MNKQITHHEVDNQINGAGKVVYKTGCGRVLLGHAGVRKDIRKVTCPACMWAARGQAPAVRAEAEVPATAQGWYDYVHSHRCTKLGEGASRKAYALDATRVIKIDKAALGQNDRFNGQCASEVARWNTSSPEIRECLATLLDSGNGWVIMERAQSTLHTFDGRTQDTISRDLGQATRIGDLHGANIGYFGKGRFKIIDYAL
jgi:hypothetical protein